jgi:5,10-methylenetetrahydromethanopterin reductase
MAVLTKKVKLAVGVTSPYSRAIAVLATTAATIDEISKGRFMLGLGTQPRFWNQLGVEDENPLTTIREAVGIVRRILAGETVSYEGKMIKLRGAKLEFNPPRNQIPVYLGAIKPKMLELAGEIADGVVLSAMCSPDYVKYALNKVKDGAKKAGRNFDEIDIACYVLAWSSKDDVQALPLVRKWIAAFLGPKGREIMLGKGTYDDARIESIRKFVAEGKLSEAGELVTEEMIDSISVNGDDAEFRHKLKRYLSAGVKLPIIQPVTGDLKNLLPFLEQ